MALDMELQTYLKHRPAWVQEGRVGSWVVIHGSDVLGFYSSFDAALEAGYERYGINEVFMARQIAGDRTTYSLLPAYYPCSTSAVRSASLDV